MQNTPIIDIREANDILRECRSLSLWQIKPGDENAEHACKILEKALLPGNRETYAIAISRLLQHFPARQTERDAVIISDLTADCVEDGIALCALVKVCHELRKESSLECPFLPPSGEILQRALKQTREWKSRLDILKRPPPTLLPKPAPKVVQNRPSVPWLGKQWGRYDNNDKKALQQHLRTLAPLKRKEYSQYLQSMCGVPKEVFYHDC